MAKAKGADELVIKNKVLLPVIYGCMGLCLLVASVLALVHPLPYADNPVLMRALLGCLGLPFSLWLVISNFRKAVTRRNAIVIDAAGITDRTGGMAHGFIAWDDVAEVYLLKLKDDTFLCVEPRDRESWMATLGRGARRLAQANIDAGFAPIRIQFKKADERYVAADGLAVAKTLHPEKVTHVRKPKY